jgi:proteasome lid subunit RPN8/RPN11
MKVCEPLRLSRSLLEALSREASASGREVVGFLLGVGCRALVVFPMENLASSSVEFLANPLDVVAAHNLAEALGLELIALYHSHPFG